MHTLQWRRVIRCLVSFMGVETGILCRVFLFLWDSFLADTAFATAPLLVCLRRPVPATVVRLPAVAALNRNVAHAPTHTHIEGNDAASPSQTFGRRITFRWNVMSNRLLFPIPGITARSCSKDSLRQGLTAGKSPMTDGVMRENRNVLRTIFFWNVPRMIVKSPGNRGSAPRTPASFCFCFWPRSPRRLWSQRRAKFVPILGAKATAPGQSKLILAIKGLGPRTQDLCESIFSQDIAGYP